MPQWQSAVRVSIRRSPGYCRGHTAICRLHHIRTNRREETARLYRARPQRRRLARGPPERCRPEDTSTYPHAAARNRHHVERYGMNGTRHPRGERARRYMLWR